MSQALSDAGLSDRDFGRFRDLLYRHAGISLSDNKKALIAGRLQRRLHGLGISSYSAYLQKIEQPNEIEERRKAIDLLTTNETYFWREPGHFGLLADEARRVHGAGRELRVWSAACSSGEETYTMAMVLQRICDQGVPLRWSVLGSDISERMLQRAVKGHYPLDRAQQMPRDLLSRYCLRGTGAQDGTLLVGRELRQNVQFAEINLVEELPNVGQFDVIFLRNVLIYFDLETKRQVVKRLIRHLRPGGLFCVGLAESLNGLIDELEPVAPGAHRLRSRA